MLMLGLVLCSLHCGLMAMARSAGAGIEYVKACDSGSDDVTNQCINRIPEDVGINSGNHACAYHEAEVKCLGLCGNTVTWKVAYMNALKRYRLVCANYIDERLAEKEEEVDSGGGESNSPPPPPPPKKKKETADSDDSPKAKKNNSAIDNALEVGKAIAKKAGPPKKEAAPLTSSAVAKDKPASTPTTAAPKTINVDLNQLQSATNQVEGHTTKRQPEHKTDDSDRMKKEIKDHAQAMLPSMDPEIAAASFKTIPLTSAMSLVVVIAVVASGF
ncbi:hypothetical protein H4S07_000837 [Coemansia furcata]|uniref:Uncharacterized protein n=1 Tax=Coemansia furcata TaxID=417177 RepID=A0ACC1LQZ8_9FUNG|nr:hypothetical protein H4S07_000837 [Coemansia furcata]